MADIQQMQGLMEVLGVHNQAQEQASLPPNYVAGGAMGKAGFAQGKTQVAVKKPQDKQKLKDEVWKDEDLAAGSGVTVKAKGDDRPEPKYDILLRQDIGAEDMYLNMGDRDPGSDHCSHLVVKVWMPKTELKNITLEVLSNRVLVQAPNYSLNLALPHPVRKDDGKAEWEKLQGMLKVTLPIETKVTYIKDLSELAEQARGQ